MARLKLTRNQLASFLPDHETVKQFETLFTVVDEINTTGYNDAVLAAGLADTKAQQALDSLERVSNENLFSVLSNTKAQQALDSIERVSNENSFAALAPTNFGGTVSSVNVTLTTTGTDVSFSTTNSTTAPVIALSIPTASAVNRGALSAADWTTFNAKGSGTVTGVTGTAPVVSSGGAAPAISMAAASTTVDGYLTAANFTTFNNKGSGSVTSVSTGTGLSGGPITGTGTINFAIAAVGTWAATPSSSNLAAAMTDETGSGPLVFATRPTITTTLGVGGATASASGSGISFPATQSASTDANTLDDYEEGTWTLTVTPGSGTITSYTVQTQKYTKLGNLVTAIIKFTITNNGTGASFLQINLPFTSADECMGTIRDNGVTGTQGNIRTSGANAFLLTYNSLYPAVTGAVITGTVTFNV